MEKLVIKQVIKLVLEPQGFKNLKKLNDNILAYGKLEYLLGYYTGMFKDFRDLCNEIGDLRVVLVHNINKKNNKYGINI